MERTERNEKETLQSNEAQRYEKPQLKRLGLLRDLTKQIISPNSVNISDDTSEGTTTFTW